MSWDEMKDKGNWLSLYLFIILIQHEKLSKDQHGFIRVSNAYVGTAREAVFGYGTGGRSKSSAVGATVYEGQRTSAT